MKKIVKPTLTVSLIILCTISFSACNWFTNNAEQSTVDTETNQDNVIEDVTEENSYSIINLNAFRINYFFLPAISLCHYSDDTLVKEEWFSIPNESTEYFSFMIEYRYDNGVINELLVSIRSNDGVFTTTLENNGNNIYCSDSEDFPIKIELEYHESMTLKSRSVSLSDFSWRSEYNELGQLIKDSENSNSSIEYVYSGTNKFAESCKITLDNETIELKLTTKENELVFDVEDYGSYSFNYNGITHELKMECKYAMMDNEESYQESILFSDNNGNMVMTEHSGCVYANNVLTQKLEYKFSYEQKNGKSIMIETKTLTQSAHKYTTNVLDENGEYVSVDVEHSCYTRNRTTYEMNESGTWIDVTPQTEVVTEELSDNSHMSIQYTYGELSLVTIIVNEEFNNLGLPTKYTQYDYEGSSSENCFTNSPAAIYVHRATYDENSRFTELYTTDLDENTTHTTFSYSTDEHGHDVTVAITEENGEFAYKWTISYSEDGKYTIETLEKTLYMYDIELGGVIEAGTLTTVTTKDADGTVIEVKYYLNGEEFTPQQPPIVVIPPLDGEVTITPAN